jgi:hypothetical protein
MKDWLARWCGCHVVLFLSYLQKDKGELLHVRRAKELDKNKTVRWRRAIHFGVRFYPILLHSIPRHSHSIVLGGFVEIS